MNSREWFGLLILIVLAFSVLAFTRSDLQVPTPVDSSGYSDSAGTVTDGSIDTDAMTTTGVLDFNMPGVRIFSDSLVLSSIWCGYHTWYEDSNAEDDCDTNFVACPVAGDSTNTIVLFGNYHSWLGLNFGATIDVRTHMHPMVAGYVEGEGYWARCMVYDAAEFTAQGFGWVLVRFSPP